MCKNNLIQASINIKKAKLPLVNQKTAEISATYHFIQYYKNQTPFCNFALLQPYQDEYQTYRNR